MTRKILSSALVIVALIGGVAGSAFAIFRDTEFIPGNTISTGTVDITLNDGMGQLPSPISAQGLMPGQWSDWTRANVYNNSNGSVKLYFYVTDVDGDACHYTNLEIASGEGMDETVYNSGLKLIKGADNKVEVTGYEFDPSLPGGETASFYLRAGLDLSTPGGEETKTCTWTGVFLAEPYADEEPPVSDPVSFPEEEELEVEL